MNEQFVRTLLEESTLLALAPLLALTAGVVLLLLVDMLPRMSGARPFVVLASIATAYAFEMRILRGGTIELFDGTFSSGPTTAAFGILFLASTLIAWAVSHNYYREERSFLGEHDIRMWCAAAGRMLMAGAQDLLVFFVGLELLSIPLYTLAGFRRARSQSVEAGIKYFVLGAFATATLLYGTANPLDERHEISRRLGDEEMRECSPNTRQHFKPGDTSKAAILATFSPASRR